MMVKLQLTATITGDIDAEETDAAIERAKVTLSNWIAHVPLDGGPIVDITEAMVAPTSVILGPDKEES